MKTIQAYSALWAIMIVTSCACPAAAEIVDGHDTGGVPRTDAVGTAVSFEPPPVFGVTLPATSWINKGLGIKKLKGGGGILDSATFTDITGESAPNFLAFNCASFYSDGSSPSLPEKISLTNKNSQVTFNIATTGASVGKSVTVTAKGAGVPQVIVLGTAMTTVTLTGTGIKNITIEETDPDNPACVVAIDDFTFTAE